MTRYIDAEQYIKTVESFVQSKGYIIPSDITRLINNAPPIDAVEVVRCKDCRFSEIFQNDSSGVMAMYCRAFTFERMVAEDDYCSYGEKREEVNGFKRVGQAWNTSQERREEWWKI